MIRVTMNQTYNITELSLDDFMKIISALRETKEDDLADELYENWQLTHID